MYVRVSIYLNILIYVAHLNICPYPFSRFSHVATSMEISTKQRREMMGVWCRRAAQNDHMLWRFPICHGGIPSYHPVVMDDHLSIDSQAWSLGHHHDLWKDPPFYS